MKKIISYLAGVVCAASLFSCSDSGSGDEPQAECPRTVLVYMAADNSLGSQFNVDDRNINQMKKVAQEDGLNGGRLLVFHDPSGAEVAPVLFEITAGGTQVLKTYSTEDVSTDPVFMQHVLADSRAFAPAKSNWLVLWSHGTGWIETAASRDPAASPLSFGQDKNPVNREMTVRALAGALGVGNYDVIYFDCCFMGCVEALYELRRTATQIVASATELPIEGMPYDVNTRVMFRSDATAAAVAANTLDYYLNSPSASTSSCTIAVVETSALEELAAASREVMQSGAVVPGSYSGVPFFRRGGANSRTHDMGHYYQTLCGSDAGAAARWKAAYDKAISYKGCTPVCYGLDMSGFTGIGTYIVRSAGDAQVDGYYNQSWWKDVVSVNPSLQ